MVGGGALEVGGRQHPHDGIGHCLGVGIVEGLALGRHAAEHLALVEQRQRELAAVVRAAIQAHPPALDDVHGVCAVEGRVDELALSETGGSEPSAEVGEDALGKAVQDV